MISDNSALDTEARTWLEHTAPVDVVIGIPSYNNDSTIGYVVTTADTGFSRYFPGLRAAIINADGGSSDRTQAVVRDAAPADIPVLSMPYRGLPGKGSAFRAIFESTAILGAKAAVVVDSDLRSITPQWIDRLLGPVIRDGYDYVAPLYIRHKHDGTITNNITYPLTRMLYGLDVRQPIGGDFGFSGRLAKWWLLQDVWESDVARFGIDIWMTTTAIAEGYRVAQAGLGLKIHDAKDPAASLGPMFSQVVGTLFDLMERYAPRWQAVGAVSEAPLMGDPPAGEPEPVPVSLPALLSKFQAGLVDHAATLEQVLSPQSGQALQSLAGRTGEPFAFPPEVWARIVLDFALASHRGLAGRERLMPALVPLYYGRVAGMVGEARDLDAAAFEQAVVQAQAEVFQHLKPELIRDWQEVATGGTAGARQPQA